MKLWQGPDINNLTEHVSQSFEQQEESWIEVELYEPYIIDAGKELVFGIEWNDFGSPHWPAKDVTLTAEFDDKVAVKNIIDAEVKIFPNPARDKLYVESSEIIKQIRLINISGQVITDITVDELSTEINVSNLRPGVYFMQIHTKESVITERVQIVQ